MLRFAAVIVLVVASLAAVALFLRPDPIGVWATDIPATIDRLEAKGQVQFIKGDDEKIGITVENWGGAFGPPAEKFTTLLSKAEAAFSKADRRGLELNFPDWELARDLMNEGMELAVCFKEDGTVLAKSGYKPAEVVGAWIRKGWSETRILPTQSTYPRFHVVRLERDSLELLVKGASGSLLPLVMEQTSDEPWP